MREATNILCMTFTHQIEDKKSVVSRHCNDADLKFSVSIKERQDQLATMYRLPKLHKRPYKARCIANSSACITSELSKLLISYLTVIIIQVIRYCAKVYERSGTKFDLVKYKFY